MNLPRMIPAVTLVACLVAALPLQAEEEAKKFPKLEQAMADIATEVADYLKKESTANSACVVKKYNGGEGMPGGAAMALILRTKLEQMGIKLHEPGTRCYSVGGRFIAQAGEGDDDRECKILIITEITAPNGSIFSRRTRVVTDKTEFAQLTALNVDTTPKTAPSGKRPAAEIPIPQKDNPEGQREVTKRFNDAIENPQIHTQTKIEGRREATIVKPSANSPYGMDLLLKQKDGSYLPIPLEEGSQQDGVARVKFDMKDVFAVRLHNQSKAPVGVILTLDGVNMFFMSEVKGWKELGKMSLSPGIHEIHGWNVNQKISRAFRVTEFGGAVAAKLGIEEGLNSITAVFVTFNPAVKSVSSQGIDVGPEIHSDFKATFGEFGEMLGAVTIHYSPKNPPIDLPAEALPK